MSIEEMDPHDSSDEDADLSALVAAGLMSKRVRSFVPEPIFVVTDASPWPAAAMVVGREVGSDLQS